MVCNRLTGASPPYTSKGDTLRNAGPDPKRFTVPQGQLGNIASAAFPFLVRLGSGGFASGYSSGFKADDGTYGVVKVGGQSVSEVGRSIEGRGLRSGWQSYSVRLKTLQYQNK